MGGCSVMIEIYRNNLGNPLDLFSNGIFDDLILG